MLPPTNMEANMMPFPKSGTLVEPSLGFMLVRGVYKQAELAFMPGFRV